MKIAYSRRTVLGVLAATGLCSAAMAGVLDWYNGVKLGSKLPVFETTIISGEVLPEDSLTLIDFWATWCAPCRESIPRLNELHDKYRGKGLSVVGLTQEKLEVAKPFLLKVPMRYTVGAGDQKNLQAALGIKALPYAIFVNRAGTIIWRGQPEEINAALIESLLKAASDKS